MKIKKVILVILMVIILAFNVRALLIPPCGPSLPPSSCLNPLACGAKECSAAFSKLDAVPSSTCSIAFHGTCIAKPVGPCPYDVILECTTSKGVKMSQCGVDCTADCQALEAADYAMITAQNEATALLVQTGIIESGNFFLSLIPCSELVNCFLKTPNFLQTTEGLKMAGGCLTKQAIKFMLSKFGEAVKEDIDKNADPTETKTAQAMVETGYKTGSTSVAAGVIITCADKCDKNQLIDFLKVQDTSILADQSVRDAMAQTGTNLPWWKHALVIAEMIASNPHVNVEAVGLKSDSSGREIYVIYFSEDDKEGQRYSQVVYDGAKNDISAAKSSSADGQSTWTNCPGHRSSECAGKPICVVDTKDGASQCVAALPKDWEIKFSSIHVIDNALSNMFTLTGNQNQGVVYQKDGFVNIDKGGTTKISVAGQGALISDFNKNQLYLGRGTTTYFGIGNQEADTYLTNTFIFNPKSSVAVAAVNPSEQQKLRENKAININRDERLSLTFDKQKLNLYMNGVDISGLAGNYLILTRGFSNIKLVERDKSFPLASRNYVKGNSLIVKNKGIAISKEYDINDATYKYKIKTVDSSTKVIAENGKILEDSSPMSYSVSPRQEILLYKNTFT